MKVLLYYPENFVKATYVPPYSLMYPAKALLEDGHEVVLIDARFDEDKRVDSELKDSDILGVSAGMNLQYATSLNTLRKAKEYGCKVVLGGVFATLNREFILRNPDVDFIIRGESLKTIGEAVSKDYKRARDVSYISSKGLVDNPSSDRPVDLDMYMPLPWNLIEPERYVHDYKGMRLYYYTTSRGCPHRCVYCYQKSFWKRKWRGISPGKVLEDIDMLSEMADFDALYLFDDNFMASRSRAYDIVDGFFERGLKWGCLTRADYINEEFVGTMKDKGCYKVCIGAESGSQMTLDRMNKDIKVEDTKRAAELIGRFKLYSEFFFMIGYLGESMEDVSKTVDLADYVEGACNAETFIRVTLPFYGTEYYDMAFDAGFKRGEGLDSICREDWTNNSPELPWFSPSENRKLRCIASLSEMTFLRKKSLSELPMGKQVLLRALGPIIDYRWKHRIWDHPIEIIPYQMLSYYSERKTIKEALEGVSCDGA
ncbi:MAG: radical SAM protein [Halobacteriota archaeon]|nr:radical SAM protein [Halobacteriota archaeon]